MKKNVGKKIRLMALLASLTLVLWGGVIACSSDSGDDDGDNGGNTEQGAGENGAGGGTTNNGGEGTATTIKLKGAFFENGEESTPWVYCTEQLTEKESGIWEGEITSVYTKKGDANKKGWDNFGVEVNGTWYGAEEGLEGDITDAKLVKDSNKNFWLATDKGGKTKVTVNLNTMTITTAALDSE